MRFALTSGSEDRLFVDDLLPARGRDLRPRLVPAILVAFTLVREKITDLKYHGAHVCYRIWRRHGCTQGSPIKFERT